VFNKRFVAALWLEAALHGKPAEPAVEVPAQDRAP